ncbi:MAG: hypothetical protein V1792_04735 [Pseudomonadota bacterium]
MIGGIQELLDQYVRWLRDKTSLRQVKDFPKLQRSPDPCSRELKDRADLQILVR